MATSMSIAISTPTSSLLHSSSSSSGGKVSSFSNSAISVPKNAIFQHIKCVPQLGLTPFSQWNGLKNLGVSVSQYSVKIGNLLFFTFSQLLLVLDLDCWYISELGVMLGRSFGLTVIILVLFLKCCWICELCFAERKGKCKGKGVYASLFGVGAPEVLVIGVVALLVFGPKGLAEVSFPFCAAVFKGCVCMRWECDWETRNGINSFLADLYCLDNFYTYWNSDYTASPALLC